MEREWRRWCRNQEIDDSEEPSWLKAGCLGEFSEYLMFRFEELADKQTELNEALKVMELSRRF